MLQDSPKWMFVSLVAADAVRILRHGIGGGYLRIGSVALNKMRQLSYIIWFVLGHILNISFILREIFLRLKIPL